MLLLMLVCSLRVHRGKPLLAPWGEGVEEQLFAVGDVECADNRLSMSGYLHFLVT